MSRASASNVDGVTTLIRRISSVRMRTLVLWSCLSLLCIGFALTSGCIDPPDFTDAPKIEFVGMSKDTILQGTFQEDSLFVVFRFEDGDGDVGRRDNADENNVFFIDTRSNSLDNSFGIPYIPPQGSSNGIEGEVQILLFSTCCIFDTGQDPCTPSTIQPYDVVSYEIYIVDRAGHESNRIVTPPITLVCN